MLGHTEFPAPNSYSIAEIDIFPIQKIVFVQQANLFQGLGPQQQAGSADVVNLSIWRALKIVSGGTEWAHGPATISLNLVWTNHFIKDGAYSPRAWVVLAHSDHFCQCLGKHLSVVVEEPDVVKIAFQGPPNSDIVTARESPVFRAAQHRDMGELLVEFCDGLIPASIVHQDDLKIRIIQILEAQ